MARLAAVQALDQAHADLAARGFRFVALAIAEHLVDRLAALGCDAAAANAMACRPLIVARTRLIGLREPTALARTFLTPTDFEHGAHRAAGDDAGTFRSRLHEHARRAVVRP